ncbi:hypothetical protein FRACA_3110010 [Frankia canadensis]|uniref:Uncharacterized protein n=1 Tax=Frankia canadensis TaxID=1836972 RepID=A0A2I2KUD6_9ACTN|nr:hypothetical protein FRACA_3110010 [Frankia canadensis]SOU56552.1 hypothetical protein FRACA_3110010 [Frankia canadensis]
MKMLIALAAVGFLPGVGEAAWAVRAYKGDRLLKASRVGEAAYRSRLVGAESRFVADKYTTPGVKPGLFNGKRATLAWSALGAKRYADYKSARTVFRAKVGKHHIDLLHGPWR